ncbi:MAG: hypothetical protein ISS66_15845 [Desulfobacteraceae bacterium]|nr:hypothetical protein [Desulfobacteraceae bacterium]
MKREFQAKDIQKFLGIPKHRYEYLISKLGIKPEIYEADETGKVHLYSFKNLLQLAFVNQANKLGLNPRSIKEMLGFLSNRPELQGTKLFDPESSVDISLHYVENKGKRYFTLSGSSITGQAGKGIYPKAGFQIIEKLLNHTKKKDSTIETQGLFDEIKIIQNLLSTGLENAECYITLNLGVIKNRILEKV